MAGTDRGGRVMAGRTDKIRSLHINTERTWRGGEQQIYYLVAGLAQRGHPVTLVCQDGEPLHKRADTLPIEVVPMKVRGELSVALPRRWPVVACVSLRAG